MSEETPLFRVIGPNGEDMGVDGWMLSIDGHPRSDFYRVEWLRDPRPCAEQVQAVVEAAEQWAEYPGMETAGELRDAVRALAALDAKEGENG